MKRIRIIALLLLSLLTFTKASAEGISESKARQIASDFMANRTLRFATMKKARKAPSKGTQSRSTAAYYVFNANEGGFVIVAGDDCAPAVLAYSDEGTFTGDDVPEAMQTMLDSYATQIAALGEGTLAAAQPISGPSIPPLVKAQWSQNSPFNSLLPIIPSTGKQAVVGCVATALAQVMRYWRWPMRPSQPLPAYTTQSLSINMPELPATDFKWSIMQDSYEQNDATAAAQAAATLSLYCAQALQMDFQNNSSGAVTTSISKYSAAYFDYDASAHAESRSSYSTHEWADLILSELLAGRPVIYSGSKMSGGHAFICDGFDGQGRFHINWGWNGNSDGYFLLNVLNPDQQGTGSASGDYGYILDQSAIVGFQPSAGGNHLFELTATDVALNSHTDSRDNTYEPFKVYVSALFQNYTSDDMDVRFGWGLFEDDAFLERLASSYINQLPPGYYTTDDKRELSFGQDRISGTYLIRPIYSEIGQDNWRPCSGALNNYIEITIDENQCHATGYGTAGQQDYSINDIAITGSLHNARPVDIDVSMTNQGHSDNGVLYMFVNNKFAAASYVGLAPNETGDIHFTHLFSNPGDYILTWSWNADGTVPIATRDITINAMPAASLSATVEVLNVTDATEKIVSSEQFSFLLTIKNEGETTYDEDVSSKLFKLIQETSGTNVQDLSQHLTLAPGQTATMQFDFDNVSDGWKYFSNAYYYSEGVPTRLAGTSFYTITKPVIPANLSASAEILDATEDDTNGRIIDSKKFSIVIDIVNNGEKTYTDKIKVKLFEVNGQNDDTEIQSSDKYLTLGSGENTTLQFDFDNVSDEHKYYVLAYFYSLGEEKELLRTTPHTIVFPILTGDVNGDSEITIADVTALVNIILGKAENGCPKATDVNHDGEATIADVTALVNIILGKAASEQLGAQHSACQPPPLPRK